MPAKTTSTKHNDHDDVKSKQRAMERVLRQWIKYV